MRIRDLRSTVASTLSVAVLATGCTSRDDAPPNSFAAQARAELDAMSAATSVASWSARHPGDSVVTYLPVARDQLIGEWCARASTTITLASGLRIQREAFFVEPLATPSLPLPAASDSATLVRDKCGLIGVKFTAVIADDATAKRQSDAVQAALAGAFREVSARTDGYFGSAYWQWVKSYERDSLRIITVHDTADFHTEVKRRTLLVVGVYPRSGLSIGSQENHRPDAVDTTGDQISQEHPQRIARFAAASDDSISTITSAPGRPDDDSVRIRRLGDWLARAHTGSAEQRAAAFLVTDLLVPTQLGQEDSLKTYPYTQLGATYYQSEIGGFAFEYAHNFVDSAIAIAPESPAGRYARLWQMRAGFNLSGMCSGGRDPFMRVSAEGIRFLTSERDPALRAEVTFMIADGYADIVALAAGAGDIYEEPKRLQSLVPEARRKAIEYYRAGLALDRTSSTARRSWTTAWRLIAGLPPLGTRFFCVYD